MDRWWLRRWVLMMWRDIISNVLWVLLLGGLDEVVLRRPKMSSESSPIGPDGDDPSPMLLRLMADGEGNEVGKVEDVPVSQGWGEGRCLRVARIIGGRGRDEWRVSSLLPSMISSVYSPSAIPNSGVINWRTRLPRQNWTVPGSSKFVMTTWRWKVEHSFIVSSSTSWGPKGNSRKRCLISAVGPEDDATPFLFFEAGTVVFLPLEDNIVYLH
ncbi:hypothetical protein GOBAR_AA19562 [Gossypium barbadense]|uniref:Uncharacterized protein n=1 Tax=Gossypium barbadense TaxID=3634 RepID=A0A2P5XCN3_GOSBA|nr:hypothetical protein GOBAR_AA19562 [Gossypium barbadense]